MYYIKSLLFFLILIASSAISLAQEISASDLFNKFKEHRVTNLDSALFYAKATIKYSTLDQDSLLMVKGNNAAGFVYNEIGKYNEAIQHYEVAYSIAADHNWYDQQMFMTNNLGISYQRKGDFDKSLEYHLRSLALREKYGTPNHIGVSKSNIGVIFYNLKQYDNALKYFEESLSEISTLSENELNIRTNIGLCLIGKGRYEEALKTLDYVIANCSDCSSDLKSGTFSAMGLAFFEMGVESLAQANFLQSEKFILTSSDKTLSIVNNHYLSLIAIEKDNFQEAQYFLEKSIERANELNSLIWKRNNLLVASKIEETTGDFSAALEHYKKYQSLNDSLINEKVVQNIQNLQYEFNNNKYQQFVASMDLRLAKKNKMNTLLGVMVLLVSIVGLVLYNANKNRKRATTLISKAYIEVERQKSRLEDAVKERTAELDKSTQDLSNFIYKTSHDIRGPLATLKGICNIALMDVTDPIAIKYFNKLELTSDRLIDILSRIQHINLIKNYRLEEGMINVADLVHEVIESIDDNIKGGISCDISIPQESYIKSDSNLLKIVLKNIVHNSFKFKQRHNYESSYVSVSMQHDDKICRISVVDNGYGIEQGEIQKVFDLFYKNDMKIEGQNSAGIGLHLAEMAVKKLNGSIQVQSIPMVKTIFTISLPVNKHSAVYKQI